MKILYDYQIFTSQKYGGISRYFYELVNCFRESRGIQTDVSLVVSNNYYLSDKKNIKHINFFPNKNFIGQSEFMSVVNKQKSIVQLKKQEFDLFHPTYYNAYFLNFIKTKPFVVTVYDMIHEKFSDMFSVHDNTSKNKKLLCEKASKIIAISKSTKKDLVEILKINPSKIEVVYLGNSLMVDNNAKLNIKMPSKYILFVGSRGGYKNFIKFIKSIAKILIEENRLSVICIGGGKFSDNEMLLLNKLKINGRIFQYDLNDNSLALFYKNAELFVFPSLYEGFGIPILEAFACECPVVCSNTSSLPEIATDGAEYFDPYDKNSIYTAVKTVLNNKKKKKTLIKNGSNRLKCFSWKKTAEQTKRIYQMILN